MSTDRATAEGTSGMAATNAVLVTGLLAALPAVLVIYLRFDGNLYAVFLTTLAMGALPPYSYSKRSRRDSPGRAALWGLGVALAVFAAFLGLWVALRESLGADGAALVAFLAVLLAIYGALTVR
ncbi:hypothetical protein ACFR9U_02295 [Halorientalis brevis]|uniref:Uncharacterized protein n=1 Tax=Halorientalis brevis TaxID=1126241 RepID=A0ABD6C8K6_9EURY|nr:hypothetical protein [Halorientalis brevis]